MSKYYWYVISSHGTDYGSTTSAQVIGTLTEWFPIGRAISHLEKSQQAKSIVILSWKSISEDERKDYVEKFPQLNSKETKE